MTNALQSHGTDKRKHIADAGQTKTKNVSNQSRMSVPSIPTEREAIVAKKETKIKRTSGDIVA